MLGLLTSDFIIRSLRQVSLKSGEGLTHDAPYSKGSRQRIPLPMSDKLGQRCCYHSYKKDLLRPIGFCRRLGYYLYGFHP